MNKILKYLLSADSFYLLAAGLFGPIYAIFVVRIGGDILEAGIAYTAFSLAAGLMIILVGRWEDRVRHKEKLLVLGYSLGSAGILGYLFVSNPLQLFLVQIVLGLGEAVRSPAYDCIYSTSLDKGKYASEWGMYDSLVYIVGGISAAIGGLVASFFGFQTLFILMFLLSLSSMAISARLYYLNKKPTRL